MEIRALAHEMMPEIIEFRRDLHRHPEASLQEFRTTDRIAEELDKLGVSYRRLDPTPELSRRSKAQSPAKRSRCAAILMR